VRRPLSAAVFAGADEGDQRVGAPDGPEANIVDKHLKASTSVDRECTM
jgi:hypothetical protein